MAVTLDPILRKLRKKDFTENDIKMIAESVMGTPVQEVISVATYADLEAIENPSTEAIYIVTSTNNLYRYNSEAFILITGEIIDNTIYVSNLDTLLSLELENASVYRVLFATQTENTYDITIGNFINGHGAGSWQAQHVQKYYPTEITYQQAFNLLMACTDANPIRLYGVPANVKNTFANMHIVTVDETYVASYTFESYSLSINQTGDKTLVGREGWATIINGRWAWEKYALEKDINEVKEELDGKQDALVSGTNIKTVNGQSILGQGNIEIQQNVMVGTQAMRLAYTPFEGLEWVETNVDPVTGEDHIIRYIYENGAWSVIESPETETDETVVLHVSTYDGLGDVEGLAIGVTDNTEHDSHTYYLNASGQCTFKIRKGHTYTVTVASLTGYHDLPDETFEAVQDDRSINMVFQAAATSYERVVVHITAYNASMQNSSALQDEFIGETVTCNVVGEAQPLTALIGSDHTAVFNIPYGKQYSIHVPYVAGFIAIYQQEWSHTASIPERTLPAHYLVWNGSDIMVLDTSSGQLLSYDVVNAMSQAEKDTLASHCALYINTSALQAANASFCYKLPLSTAGKAWAAQNVQFDTDLLPYKQSHAAAVVCLNGPTNTQNIRSIGDSLGVETPGADWCVAQQLTVNGTTYNGYMGEYGEMKQLADNLSQLTAFHLLLGFPAPTFNSGYWWTSTQYSDTNAVWLYNGGFGSNDKDNSRTCIALFRPFGN